MREDRLADDREVAERILRSEQGVGRGWLRLLPKLMHQTKEI
jgi:SOS response regulatory protein OraA/RecX